MSLLRLHNEKIKDNVYWALVEIGSVFILQPVNDWEEPEIVDFSVHPEFAEKGLVDKVKDLLKYNNADLNAFVNKLLTSKFPVYTELEYCDSVHFRDTHEFNELGLYSDWQELLRKYDE